MLFVEAKKTNCKKAKTKIVQIYIKRVNSNIWRWRIRHTKIRQITATPTSLAPRPKRNSHKTNNGADKQRANAVKHLTSHRIVLFWFFFFFFFCSMSHTLYCVIPNESFRFDNKLPQNENQRFGGWIFFSHTKKNPNYRSDSHRAHNQQLCIFFRWKFWFHMWIACIMKYITLRNGTLNPLLERKK